MEPNKVVQALKILRDEGREDLIKEGVLEEAWVGLKRPKRLSSGGVSAAVIACSSPPKKCKKFKNKSAEGRKVTRSLEGLWDMLHPASRSTEEFVAHKRGAGRCSRRSGVSLAQRVAAGGKGVGRLVAVAGGERQGAQWLGARASEAARGRRASKQAQLPWETMLEHRAAILDERVLGGTLKMAAPTGKSIPLPVSLEERQLADAKKMAARVESCEEIIIISDEERERHDGVNLGKGDIAVKSVRQFDGGAGEDVIRELSLDRGLCKESMDGYFGSQNVLKLGEKVEFVDQDGVIIRGMVCGQTSRGGSKGRAQVLMDFWQPGVEEEGAGCDAPRFTGGLSEVTVHREAGRPSGGQSLPVKVRAPLVHRKEGRVKSGAVYPTARESVALCSLGHGAGLVFDDEQPSTSRGAGARFERQDEDWLDYEEDVEEQAIPVANLVSTPAVPEVFRGEIVTKKWLAIYQEVRLGGGWV
ncbi:hypothetical protein NDU88_002255 [Pleurodeles waltl]|uniref:Uncharacterized protein n=1 Tax=Pleurodeles waltl TaxID=8319 RepID=A0AAV7W1X3_PLEWA|nr:hypothetical protein NDU88_002255 [Pleurodeles waltl]